MDPPIISMLVADTFFDKLLGHGADGIDIASLNKVKEEAHACNDEVEDHACNDEVEDDDFRIILNENDVGAYFDVPTNIRKPTEKHRGIRHNPATSTAENRSCSVHASAAKYNIRKILDMDIEKFGDKPWRKSGVDISDFFNYGMDERQWTAYRSKLKKAQAQVRSSRQTKLTAKESMQSYKEGTIAGDRSDKGIDERLPNFVDVKDLISSNDSDVIIEIVKEEHMKEEGELSDGEGDTQHIKCRMINGDSIFPFPMDG